LRYLFCSSELDIMVVCPFRNFHRIALNT
jgi:hypothetical protein